MNVLCALPILIVAFVVVVLSTVAWLGPVAVLLALLAAKWHRPGTAMLDYLSPSRWPLLAFAWLFGLSFSAAIAAAVNESPGWTAIMFVTAIVTGDALVMIFQGRMFGQIFGGDRDTSESAP